MDVKCMIKDYLAERIHNTNDGSDGVKLESVHGHGDQVRLTSGNGVSCVVDIEELISAATKCRLNSIGR